MARRIRANHSGAQFLHPQEFEDEAALLLAEYGRDYGAVTEPPVPIEMIAVAYCKLALEYEDLRAKYPEGDVDGEIWFNERRIVVERRLSPEVNPSMLGRFRFTVAHEVAHWRLHRHAFLRRANEPPLFNHGADVSGPDHVLRSGRVDGREYQANRLGACILMPREMVKRAWHEFRGDSGPVHVGDLRDEWARRQHRDKPHSDNFLFATLVRPLADAFEVSAEAMRIRLEGMALLMRTKEPTLRA
jgi:hypothetical protein